MTPGKYNWPAQYAGDTARPWEIQILEDGNPVNLTGATVKLQARRDPQRVTLVDLSSDGTGITITDATAGTFSVGGYTLPDVDAMLIYDLQVLTASGSLTTYLTGTFPVFAQVTE